MPALRLLERIDRSGKEAQQQPHEARGARDYPSVSTVVDRELVQRRHARLMLMEEDAHVGEAEPHAP
eukprot:2333953-Prymnesium_polylepis.2